MSEILDLFFIGVFAALCASLIVAAWEQANEGDEDE